MLKGGRSLTVPISEMREFITKIRESQIRTQGEKNQKKHATMPIEMTDKGSRRTVEDENVESVAEEHEEYFLQDFPIGYTKGFAEDQEKVCESI